MSTRMNVSRSLEFLCTLALKTETQKTHSAALLHHLRVFLFVFFVHVGEILLYFRTERGGSFSFRSSQIFSSFCIAIWWDTFLGGFPMTPPRSAFGNVADHRWTHQVDWQAQDIGQRRKDLGALVSINKLHVNLSHFQHCSLEFSKRKNPRREAFTDWTGSVPSRLNHRYALKFFNQKRQNL